MNFETIDRLVKESKIPISGPLSGFQAIHLGDSYENYMTFLYLLVREMKAKTCLEIGIYRGAATCHMLFGGAEVIGIDILKIRLNYKGFYFLNMDSGHPEALEEVKKIIGDKKIDIVFQDGSHWYRSSRRDWELYSPLLAEGGVWICDDVTENFYDKKKDPIGKGMIEYFEELPGDKKLYDDLHQGTTQGIII